NGIVLQTAAIHNHQNAECIQKAAINYVHEQLQSALQFVFLAHVYHSAADGAAISLFGQSYHFERLPVLLLGILFYSRNSCKKFLLKLWNHPEYPEWTYC